MSAETPLFPRRPYGKQGDQLSIVGFGAIIVMNKEQDHADQVVAKAVDLGINYFDVAPSYGNAQDILGPALAPHRDKVFLACKTGKRDAEQAEAELENSLKVMRTDHFDVYQLHAVTTMEDVDKVFRKGGAMELFERARSDGRVRHLGFSAHSVEAALAMLDRFDFDSVLFPVNFAAIQKGDFGPQVIEKARQKGASRLALKAMARQKWDGDRDHHSHLWYEPLTDRRLIELALRYTLSQDITAAIAPGAEDLFFTAVEIAREFRPLTQEEQDELKKALKTAVNEPVFAR